MSNFFKAPRSKKKEIERRRACRVTIRPSSAASLAPMCCASSPPPRSPARSLAGNGHTRHLQRRGGRGEGGVCVGSVVKDALSENWRGARASCDAYCRSGIPPWRSGGVEEGLLLRASCSDVGEGFMSATLLRLGERGALRHDSADQPAGTPLRFQLLLPT